jgi:proline dehydrogenase
MEAEPRISFEDTKVAFLYKDNMALRKANFIFSVVNHPWVSAIATGSVKLALQLHLPVESIIRSTVFDHFCGGESIDKCDDEIEQIGKYGVGTILDYSVEGENSETSFDKTMEEILRTIEKASRSTNIPFSVFKVTGLASAELLEKIQSKEKLTEEEENSFGRIRNRIDRICAMAHAHKVRVLIDAEESWIQDPIDALANEMMQRYNLESAIVFNTYQLYRTVSLKNLRDAFHTAAMHQYHLGAKLVRGAYMEKERERAEKMNYPSPIHPDKEATDQAFNQALSFCIDNKQRISFMCGSHNEYSNQYLTVLMEKHSMKNSDERIWFAQLYGMSDNISFNLAKAGYKVAKYVPYGPVRSVMPYLLRRASENTSVAGQSSRELVMIKKELVRRKSDRK